MRNFKFRWEIEMRNFKFRWWDVPNKRMWSWDEVRPRACTADALFSYADSKVAGFIPLEYTGLKDKTGKEIYEGDILRHLSGELVEVKSIIPYDKSQWNDAYSWPEEYGVIGNIYANPELLNDNTI